MVLTVCPFGVAAVPPECVWKALTTPERFGEWQDAEVVAIHPPGPAQPGQRIKLVAPAFGHKWPVWIDVEGLDPDGRWMELQVRLPFGIVNHERVTLSEWDDGQTLIRFN
jgi:ligand-binding SRPBCC domain-containing protein